MGLVFFTSTISISFIWINIMQKKSSLCRTHTHTHTNVETLRHHPHPHRVAVSTTDPASVPGCQPASYGALRSPYTQQRGTQITGCQLPALRAVGPKMRRCHALREEERINTSLSGWRADQAVHVGAQQPADYLGERGVMLTCCKRACRYISLERLFTRTI